MDKFITLTLSYTDVGQIIDGLEQRRIIWQATADYLEGEEVDCIIEECSDPLEAQAIADNYQYIINTIRNQRDAQMNQ